MVPFSIIKRQWKKFQHQSRVQRRMSLLKHRSSPLVFSVVYVAWSFSVMFCRSLFVLFSFGHCVVLSFDLWIMITSLLSSNPSYKKKFKQRWSTIPPISMKRTTTSNNWTVKKDNLWSWKSRSWFGTVRLNYAAGLNQLYVFFSLLYCSISNKSHVQTRLSITFFIFHNLSQKPLKHLCDYAFLYVLLVIFEIQEFLTSCHII